MEQKAYRRSPVKKTLSDPSIKRVNTVIKTGPTNVEKIRGFCKAKIGYKLSECVYSTVFFLSQVIISCFYPETIIIHVTVFVSVFLICAFNDTLINGRLLYYMTYNMVMYFLFVAIGVCVYGIGKIPKRKKKGNMFKNLTRIIDGE